MKRLLPLLILLSGCASVTAQTLRDQSSFDLKCPAKDLAVTLGKDQRSGEVTGCGKTARYRDVAGEGPPSWMRVGE